MKKNFNLLTMALVLTSFSVGAQTYVNEMTQAEVEQDCYIEGGAASFTDNGDAP